MAEQDPPRDPLSGDGGQGGETWPTYSPPGSAPTPDAPEEQPSALPPTHVEYGKPQEHLTYPPAPGTTSAPLPTGKLVSTRGGGHGVIGAIVALLVFLGVVIGGIAAVRGLAGGIDELRDGLDSSESQTDVHSVEGFEELLAALREETGSTTVFEAVLYPDYAVIDVPVDATSQREHSYYWNGDIRQTGKSTNTYDRFDLAAIDPSVLAGLVEEARQELVEDPSSVYLIVRKPQEHDQGAWFYAYASNEYFETGYLAADENGKVIQKYLSTSTP